MIKRIMAHISDGIMMKWSRVIGLDNLEAIVF